MDPVPTVPAPPHLEDRLRRKPTFPYFSLGLAKSLRHHRSRGAAPPPERPRSINEPSLPIPLHQVPELACGADAVVVEELRREGEGEVETDDEFGIALDLVDEVGGDGWTVAATLDSQEATTNGFSDVGVACRPGCGP